MSLVTPSPAAPPPAAAAASALMLSSFSTAKAIREISPGSRFPFSAATVTGRCWRVVEGWMLREVTPRDFSSAMMEPAATVGGGKGEEGGATSRV